MASTLTFGDFAKVLARNAREIKGLLDENEMLLFGGIVRRGWTRSNVDVGFEPQLGAERKEKIVDLIRDGIERIDPEAPAIVDVVDWDFASKKLPFISFQSQIYPYRDNPWKIEMLREAKVELLNQVSLPQDLKKEVDEARNEVVEVCGTKTSEVEEKLLDCISDEVHDVRRNVI